MNKKRIVVFVVFLCCLFFMTTFAGSPEQNTIIATRDVTFIDGFNNSNISEQTIEVGTDAVVPNDPYHEGYVFAGWYLYENQEQRVEDFTNILNNLTVIARYAGDANGNGIADDDEPRYTVTFVDSFDGSILGSQEVLVGMNAVAPTTIPTHDGYVFVGWSTSLNNIRDNVTVSTVYNAVNDDDNETEETYYQVTFIDTITNEVVERVSVLEGLSANAPEGPVHEGYAFVRWDGDFSNVNSDREVRTVYVRDVNGNGVDDTLEARYQLTVDYVSVSSTGARHTLGSEVIGLFLSGETYTIPTRSYEGYVENDNQSKTGVMPGSNTTLVITYSVDGDDTNNDGINDNEQSLYTLSVQYNSVNSEGKFGESLGSVSLDRTYLDGENYDISSVVSEKSTELGDEYELVTTLLSGVIDARRANGENVIELVVNYRPTSDTNNDGITDSKQDLYSIKIEYNSVNTMNEFGESLGSVTLDRTYLNGENYDLTELVNVKSEELGSHYTLVTDVLTGVVDSNNANQDGEIVIDVNYRPVNDGNDDGIIDNKQDLYTITVIYNSVNSQGEFGELLEVKPLSKLYLDEDSYDLTNEVNAKSKELEKDYALVTSELTGKIDASKANQDNVIEVVVNYKPVNDTNGDGIIDSKQNLYTVKVQFNSVNSQGVVGETLGNVILSKTFLSGETYDITSEVTKKTQELGDKYILVTTQMTGVAGFTNADENKVITVNVDYQLTEGNDKNDDGVLDSKQETSVVVNYIYMKPAGIEEGKSRTVTIEGLVGDVKVIEIPEVEGYTPDKTNLSITLAKENEPITITYNINKYTVKLHIVSGDNVETIERHPIHGGKAVFDKLKEIPNYTYGYRVYQNQKYTYLNFNDIECVNGLCSTNGQMSINGSFTDKSARLINITYNNVQGDAEYRIVLLDDKNPEDGIADVDQANVTVEVTTEPDYSNVIFTSEKVLVKKGANALIDFPTNLDYFEHYTVTDMAGNSLAGKVWLYTNGKGIVVKTTQDTPNDMTVRVRLVPPTRNIYISNEVDGVIDTNSKKRYAQTKISSVNLYLPIPEKVVASEPYITCDDTNVTYEIVREDNFKTGKRYSIDFNGLRRENTNCVAHYKTDENGNGIADSEEVTGTFKVVNGVFTENNTDTLNVVVKNGGTYRLTVDKETITPNFGYALAGLEVSGNSCYKDSETGEVVLTNASNNSVCTITLSEDKDKNNNGTPDSEEDHYKLEIKYVRVNSKGEIESEIKTETRDNLVYSEPYRIENSNITGYTLQNPKDLVGEMPTKENMPEDGIHKVILKYRPNGIDSNDNGMNDSEESTYVLRVNYVNGADQVIGHKDYTGMLERNPYDVTVPERVEVPLTDGKVAVYVIDGETSVSGNMPRKENIPSNGIYEIKVNYNPEEGKDTNNNGINDDEEIHYDLTATYISVGKTQDNQDVQFVIKENVILGSYVEGAPYVVVNPSDLDLSGYVESTSKNVRTGNMVKGGVNVKLYYTPTIDNNHNGQDDSNETHYKVIVNHVKANGENYANPTELSVVEGDNYSVSAIENPYYTPDKTVVSGVMGKTPLNETITYTYKNPVISRDNITVTPNGWTNKDSVDIAVNAKDANGVDVLLYSFDGGKTFTTNNTITVKEDTTVSVVVKDVNGEISNTVSFTPDNIDRLEPVIDVPKSVDANGEPFVVVEFTVVDLGGSGISKVTYAPIARGEVDEESAIELTPNDQGNYSFNVALDDSSYMIYAYDNAGNRAEPKSVKISGIKSDAHESDKGKTEDPIIGGYINLGENTTSNGINSHWKVKPKRTVEVHADEGETLISVKWAEGHYTAEEMENPTNNMKVHDENITDNVVSNFILGEGRYTAVYTIYVKTSKGVTVKYYRNNAYWRIFGAIPVLV